MPYERWIPVIDNLLNQVYYRVLSFVSIHAPIDEIYLAAQDLVSKRGGNLYWLLEGRVAKWENLEAYPDIKMTVYIFGSKIRRKNVVLMRAGWWKLYLIDTLVKKLGTLGLR